MRINSKRKGKTGELEFCRVMKNYGYELKRSVQYNGKHDEGQPDVVGLDYIHCEIKRVEKLNLYDAILQAKRDAKKDQMPTVFHRKNNFKWLVTMELEDWIKLYKEYFENMEE